MMLRYVFVLLFFNFASTVPYVDHEEQLYNNWLKLYSYWPSPHNAMYVRSLMKRDGQSVSREGQSVPVVKNEGGPLDPGKENFDPVKSDVPVHEDIPLPDIQNKTVINASNVSGGNDSRVPKLLVSNKTESSLNTTVITKGVPSQLDLKNPGVLKRAMIVFGSFGLMAVVYYVVFKRKSTKSDDNTHNNNDSNQFRYGVLHSDDQRDNLELSRIPLTMDSEEDDDEDLEIFDLNQKKKSLSYVNLQTNEDDLDISSTGNFTEVRPGNDDDNLLLDIDTNEALINWSNNQSDSHFNVK